MNSSQHAAKERDTQPPILSFIVAQVCYIRCAECKDIVDLCVPCFHNGHEPRQHKRTHTYRAMQKLNMPIYTGTTS